MLCKCLEKRVTLYDVTSNPLLRTRAGVQHRVRPYTSTNRRSAACCGGAELAFAIVPSRSECHHSILTSSFVAHVSKELAGCRERYRTAASYHGYWVANKNYQNLPMKPRPSSARGVANEGNSVAVVPAAGLFIALCRAVGAMVAVPAVACTVTRLM